MSGENAVFGLYAGRLADVFKAYVQGGGAGRCVEGVWRKGVGEHLHAVRVQKKRRGLIDASAD